MEKLVKDRNRVIASFMGVRFTLELDYHSNWNSLMGVIKKALNVNALDLQKDERLAYQEICTNLFLSDIELTHRQVSEYLSLISENEDKRYHRNGMSRLRFHSKR